MWGPGSGVATETAKAMMVLTVAVWATTGAMALLLAAAKAMRWGAGWVEEMLAALRWPVAAVSQLAMGVVSQPATEEGWPAVAA